MKEVHPFLGEKNHRADVICLVKKFVKLKFDLEPEQILIGHLFFGQRAFAISGRDIGMIYGSKARYYPENQELDFKPGLVILIDEIGNSFDVGIGEISRDEVGLYFENILINIKISKKEPYDIECFERSFFLMEIYSINNYGVLREIELHKIEEIKSLASSLVLNLILFNLEHLSASAGIT